MRQVGILISCLVATALSAPSHQPAPSYGHHVDPFYDDVEPFNCPNYPFCSEAPHAIGHLQYEIDALRQRAALIVKHGELLPLQQPNQPFVQGLYSGR